MAKRLTTKEVIQSFVDSPNVDEKLWLFDRVNYVSSKTPIEIGCVECSEYFFRAAKIHRKGIGCNNCRYKTQTRDIKLPLEQAKERVFEKHGNKFQYNWDEYNGATKKITVICPHHGPTKQFFNLHLNSYGCKYCAREAQIKDIEYFVNKSRDIHGDFFNYDKSVYVGCNKELVVICPNHGDYLVSPEKHYTNLGGCRGCMISANSVARHNPTQAEILQALKDSEKVNTDLWNYDRFIYKGSANKCEIGCISCGGYFWQTHNGHSQGRGCPLCKYDNRDFTKAIKRAKREVQKVHGDLFKYNWDEFKGRNKPMPIICPIHGETQQTIVHHLKNYGCKQCYYESLRKDTDYFIARSKEIFGELFSYENSVYTGFLDNIIITCREHGDFITIAQTHYSGTGGCSKCKMSKMEIQTAKYFQDQGVKFETEKKFPDCRDTYPLRFDFYLPQARLLIELQGQQHFQAFDYLGGQASFEDRVKKDGIKVAFVAKNDIDLEVLTYADDLEQELSRIKETYALPRK